MNMQIKSKYIIMALLILIPSIVDLAVPIYNRDSPELFGIPFFYWFQTLWLLPAAGFYMAFSRLAEREL